jgi:hypothetical protein
VSANKRVLGGELGTEIVKAVREYTDAVSKAIAVTVDEAALMAKRDIAAASPRGKTGTYYRGWRVYKRDSTGVTTRIVWNSSHYSLVHLLENGHAKTGGGRVAAIPHVRPVADEVSAEMYDNIKRIVETGGQR